MAVSIVLLSTRKPLKNCLMLLRIPYTITDTILSTLYQHEKVFYRYYKNSGSKNDKIYKGKPRSVLLKSSRPLKPNCDSDHPKKKVMVIGDIDVNVKGIENFSMKELNDNIDDINPDNYEEVLQNSEFYYDMHLKETKDQRRLVRHKIMEQKCLKPPKEPSLLTWAAKDQIQYLHKLDPVEWTPETIIEHFPISLAGVQKLLNSKAYYTSKERKEEYNRLVSQTWKALAKGTIENLDESLQEKWDQHLLNITQSLPNPAFPIPPPENTKPSIFLDDPNKPPGEFLSLVKPYIEMREKILQQEKYKVSEIQNCIKNCDSTLMKKESTINDVDGHLSSVLPGSTHIDADDEYMLEKRQSRSRQTYMTHDQFEENMRRQLKKMPSERSDMMLNWMNNPTSGQYLTQEQHKPQEYKKKIIPNRTIKYKHVKVNFDKPKDAKYQTEEAYMYKTQTGYQHPFGKETSSEDQIYIDKSAVKKGKYYKVKDSYYSEEGEFLYKVF